MQTVFPYLVDGALLLIFACVVIRAWHIGFARAMAGIAAWIAAAVLALHFCTPLAQTVYTRYFEERVTQMAVQEIEDKSGAVETVQITTDVLSKIPQSAVRAAQSVGVDIDALGHQVQQVVPTSEDLAQQVEQQVLEPVIVAALKVVLFLLILIVVSALVQAILSPIGHALHKLPAIGTADRALGGVLGILKGAVAVAIMSIVLRIAAGVVEGEVARAVSMSKIIPFIENSPFAGGFFQS